MRNVLVGILSLVILSGCPSPEEVCKSGVDQVCERSFECQPAQVKASAQFQAAFGTSVEDCKAKLYANPGAPAGATLSSCASRTDQNQNCTGTDTGKSFDVLAARDCKDERAKLSCADYLAQLSDPTKSPAVCAKRCQ